MKSTAVIALVSLATGLLLASDTARAGTYDVYSCRQPSGQPAGTSGWVAVVNADMASHDACRSGGGFGVSVIAGPARDQSQGTWTFEAPDGTSIADYALHRLAHSVTGQAAGIHWVKGAALYRDQVALNPDHTEEMCMAWDGHCATLGNGTDPLGPTSAVEHTGVNAHRLIAGVHCFGPCPATTGTGAYDIYEARIGLSDPWSPVLLHDPSGSLFSHQDISGGQSVSFAATDRGGGLYRVGILVDGGATYGEQAVEPSVSSCVKPVTTPVPCPLAASNSYTFNTAVLPDGTHDIRLAMTDIAGNRTLSKPVTVRIRNHARANGANATRDARLRVGFDHRRRHTYTTRFGGRPLITGTLTRSDGTPIRDAVVRIRSRTARANAPYRGAGHATTDAGGRFRYRVHRGSSRRFRVVYRAFDLDPAPAAAGDLRLDVHAGVTLHISPRSVRNGHRIVFRGRLKGGPGRAGTLVTLQELSPKPLTFKTVHADRHGHFKAAYRFRYTYRLSRFRFRAVAQHQAGYPYLDGASRTLGVLVRP